MSLIKHLKEYINDNHGIDDDATVELILTKIKAYDMTDDDMSRAMDKIDIIIEDENNKLKNTRKQPLRTDEFVTSIGVKRKRGVLFTNTRGETFKLGEYAYVLDNIQQFQEDVVLRCELLKYNPITNKVYANVNEADPAYFWYDVNYIFKDYDYAVEVMNSKRK